jgi:hypothetical protein
MRRRELAPREAFWTAPCQVVCTISGVSGHGGNGGVQNTWAHATALLGKGS